MVQTRYMIYIAWYIFYNYIKLIYLFFALAPSSDEYNTLGDKRKYKKCKKCYASEK